METFLLFSSFWFCCLHERCFAVDVFTIWRWDPLVNGLRVVAYLIHCTILTAVGELCCDRFLFSCTGIMCVITSADNWKTNGCRHQWSYDLLICFKFLIALQMSKFFHHHYCTLTTYQYASASVSNIFINFIKPFTFFYSLLLKQWIICWYCRSWYMTVPWWS